MAFLLTLIVVTSLVYQDGYRILAQEIAPQEQAEVQTMSLEENTGEEPQETASAETEDQIPAADPTPVTEESGVGTEEGGPGTGESVTGGENAGSDASQDVPTPTPEEEPAADITGEQETVTTPTETPAADPTETPAADPTATPADPTTVPTETPAAEPTETPAEPTPTATPEPTQVPEEIVLVEQSLSVSTGDATVTLQGVMPEGATVQAVPVQVAIEGQEVLAAYDITIYDAKGQVYQPQEGAIKVDIVNAAVAEAAASAEEVSVYHMDNAASAPQEVAAAPTGDGVTFQAESFSIYVVTKPEDHYTASYIFHNADEVEINRQILSAGERLNRPQTPEVENKKFTGWYIRYDDGREVDFADSRFGQYAEVLEGLQEGSKLTESKTYNLYPRYADVFYVYYRSDNSADSSVLYTQTYTDGDAEIVTDKVPFVTEGTKALIGWTTQVGGTTPETDLRLNGADVTLYPVVADAAWITFDSQGGTAVEPVYVLAGQNTVEPEAPERAGYRFGGWYQDEDCEQSFAFGSPQTESITLYARWIAENVHYTIVYWQENPDDDGYSFEESVSGTGRTGTQTNVRPDTNKYEGFHLNTTDKAVAQQIIAGDGSTVVNVYYDRNVYEITYTKKEVHREWVDGYWSGIIYIPGHYEDVTEWVPIDELTITAKYGANIADLWPSRRTGLSENYPSMWSTNDETPGEGPYQSGIETMPLGGDAFYYVEQNGRQYRSEYYVEDLNGRTYSLHHTDNWKYNGSLHTTGEDYYAITGFEVNWDRSPEIETSAEWLWGDRRNPIYGWKFYYDRNSYNIEFRSGGREVKTETYKYEADISGLKDYVPNVKPGGQEDYVFAGWYENAECLGEPYDFSGKTMPANNMILYAKWVAPSYEVTFDLNDGEPAEGHENEYDPQTVNKGAKANEPADPVREGYKFAGWTKNGSPFSFETQIVENTKLTAQWISEASYTLTYDPNGGLESGSAAKPFQDEEKYIDGADAKLQSAPETWEAPEDGMGFICWNTQADGKGQDYYPGDVYTMPNENVTLYAKWAPARKTTLTYDYKGGKDANGNPSDTVQIAVPNEDYYIPDDRDGSDLTPPVDGYVFVGWTTDAEGTGTVLKPGDMIHVDTLSETGENENILYAKWEKRVSVTVKKTVDGNMGDRAAEFSFTYTLSQADGNEVTDKFTLTNGGERVISGLAPGDKITVTESSAGQNGYKTQINLNGTTVAEAGGNGTYTYEVPKDGTLNDVVIEFVNTREIVPPMGLSDNMAPFAAMTLAGLAAAVIFFLPRRRRQ